MKVGFVQTCPVFGAKEANRAAVRAQLRGIHADLLVLPELFATGYAFQSRRELRELAEPARGPTFECLAEIARETGAAVVAGCAEVEGRRLYNSALLVKDDALVAVYRKVHLFYKEKQWFDPGTAPWPVRRVNGARVGVMICFDWIFPEVARSLALRGAEVIAHPANLVLPYCQRAMVTRCLENRVFAVTANRVGREERGEDDFTFTGASQVVDPAGACLQEAPRDAPAVGVVEIDLTRARAKTLNAQNDLFADRRPELYDALCTRTSTPRPNSHSEDFP